MQNLLEDLTKLLNTSGEFTDENGNLLKNKVIENALKLDPSLLKLLLKNKAIKKHFFTDIDGVLVFDKIKFQNFVSNKQFLPDSYTSFKNKIGLVDEKGDYIASGGDVTLVWPYKDCVLEGGQTKEDQKRDEIFWNETLAPDEIDRLLDPKVFTNWKRYDQKGEHILKGDEKVDFNNENIVVKGNNLLALHSIYERYAGKVKLIYIDPPYNTKGATDIFTYNNAFNHSTWLTFMKNRLSVAKSLLRNDGFIAVTIDHCELFYLGSLADEIFGAENRIGIVTILINPKGRQHEKFFSAATEYMLVYAKNISIARFEKVVLDDEIAKTFDQEDSEGKFRWQSFARIRTSTSRQAKPNFYYPVFVRHDLSVITLDKTKGYIPVYPVSNGQDYTWKTKPDTFLENNVNGYFRAVKIDSALQIQHKYREQQVLKNIWTDKKYFPEFQGTNLLKKLLGKANVSYPKSLYAVIDTIKLMSTNNDIVLDFFGGSGTTAHAVIEANKEQGLNRRFILCEQLDEHIDVTYRRLQAVLKKDNLLGSSFIYCELMQWNELYMDKIQKAKTTAELSKIWNEISKNAFYNYYIDVKAVNENISNFEQLSIKEQKQFLIETLDKNQLYVNHSEIKDADYKVSDTDIKLNSMFYSRN